MRPARHPEPALRELLSPLGDAPQILEADSEGGSAVTPSVICLRGAGPPRWLYRDGWRLFASPVDRPLRGSEVELASFTLDGGRTISVALDSEAGVVTIPFSLDQAYANYLMETWKEGGTSRALSARQLGAYYRIRRLVPRRLQLRGRRALARWQGRGGFPAWPYDDSVNQLLRFLGLCLLAAAGRDELPFRWFWPHGYRAAAILTHDVESAEGLRNAIDIADLEEERGLRSSFNIVADWYPVDLGIVDELRSRGFELGVHGVRHDRSMFASRRNFDAQLPRVKQWAETLGASGFRSPATHRVNAWLAELPLDYDCTIPHSDPYEPIPGGSCSPWPYFLERVVELPYTMPQDHTLFSVLQERTIEVWLQQIRQLEAVYGMIQCVSHPDPGYLGSQRNRALYVQLLDHLAAAEGLWLTLPRSVATWWRARAAGVDPRISIGLLQRAGRMAAIRNPEPKNG